MKIRKMVGQRVLGQANVGRVEERRLPGTTRSREDDKTLNSARVESVHFKS